MIIVKAYGGLGNQMFQYAFYQYLMENNQEVYFDISDFGIHDYHNGFELSKVFNAPFRRPNEKEMKKLTIRQEGILPRALFRLFGMRLSKTFELFEQKGVFTIPFQEITKDVVMRGTWQDVQYVLPVQEKIRGLFHFPELTGKNLEVAKVMSTRPTVSVHVRRGDYLAIPQYQGVCDQAYYDRGISFFRIKHSESNPLFVFFSDDICWCKQRYSNLDAIFIDWNTGANSYIDMQLMSMCDNNIIANSSFSWWGAFLNTNDDKIVVIPEKWEKSLATNPLVYSNCIVM
jgi:putative alpha-1,2-fucosyltransferase